MIDLSELYGSPLPAAAAAAAQRTGTAAAERKEQTFQRLMAEAGLTASGQDAAEAGAEPGIIDQIADPNSAFYQDMFQRLRVQMELSEEEKKKQAIIDALGAILDGMRSTDGVVKRKNVAVSMADLSKQISELDKDDPRRKELDLFRQRLGQLGIFVDLDLGVKGSKDKDQNWLSLTEYLINEENKSFDPSIFDLI